MGRLQITVHRCELYPQPMEAPLRLRVVVVVDRTYRFATSVRHNTYTPTFDDVFYVGNTHRLAVLTVLLYNELDTGLTLPSLQHILSSHGSGAVEWLMRSVHRGREDDGGGCGDSGDVAAAAWLRDGHVRGGDVGAVVDGTRHAHGDVYGSGSGSGGGGGGVLLGRCFVSLQRLVQGQARTLTYFLGATHNTEEHMQRQPALTAIAGTVTLTLHSDTLGASARELRLADTALTERYMTRLKRLFVCCDRAKVQIIDLVMAHVRDPDEVPPWPDDNNNNVQDAIGGGGVYDSLVLAAAAAAVAAPTTSVSYYAMESLTTEGGGGGGAASSVRVSVGLPELDFVRPTHHESFAALVRRLCALYGLQREPCEHRVRLRLRGCSQLDKKSLDTSLFVSQRVYVIVRTESEAYRTPARPLAETVVWSDEDNCVSLDVVDATRTTVQVIVMCRKVSITAAILGSSSSKKTRGSKGGGGGDARCYEIGRCNVSVGLLAAQRTSMRDMYLYKLESAACPRFTGTVHFALFAENFGAVPVQHIAYVDAMHERLARFFRVYDPARVAEVDALMQSRRDDDLDALMCDLVVQHGNEPGTVRLCVTVDSLVALRENAHCELHERDVYVQVSMGNVEATIEPVRVRRYIVSKVQQTCTFDVVRDTDVLRLTVGKCRDTDVVYGEVEFTCLHMQRGVPNRRKLCLVALAGTCDAYISGTVHITLQSNVMGDDFAVDTALDELYVGRLRRYAQHRLPMYLHRVNVIVATRFDMETFMAQLAARYGAEDATYALHFTVIGCRGLPSRLGGTSAYVVVKVGADAYHTRVVRNNTEPDYFEFCEFALTQLYQPSPPVLAAATTTTAMLQQQQQQPQPHYLQHEAVVRVVVMDRRGLGADEEIGHVDIPLRSNLVGHLQHDFLPLCSPRHGSSSSSSSRGGTCSSNKAGHTHIVGTVGFKFNLVDLHIVDHTRTELYKQQQEREQQVQMQHAEALARMRQQTASSSMRDRRGGGGAGTGGGGGGGAGASSGLRLGSRAWSLLGRVGGAGRRSAQRSLAAARQTLHYVLTAATPGSHVDGAGHGLTRASSAVSLASVPYNSSNSNDNNSNNNRERRGGSVLFDSRAVSMLPMADAPRDDGVGAGGGSAVAVTTRPRDAPSCHFCHRNGATAAAAAPYADDVWWRGVVGGGGGVGRGLMDDMGLLPPPPPPSSSAAHDDNMLLLGNDAVRSFAAQQQQQAMATMMMPMSSAPVAANASPAWWLSSTSELATCAAAPPRVQHASRSLTTARTMMTTSATAAAGGVACGVGGDAVCDMAAAYNNNGYADAGDGVVVPPPQQQQQMTTTAMLPLTTAAMTCAPPPRRGRAWLHVRLVGCVNLLCDGGVPNPFVMLSTLRETHRSRVLFDTANPYYDEGFVFDIDDAAYDALRVTVLTDTPYGARPLGHCVLSLRNVPRDQPCQRHVALVVHAHYSYAHEHGAVRLLLHGDGFGVDYLPSLDAESRLRERVRDLLLANLPQQLHCLELFVGDFADKENAMLSSIFSKRLLAASAFLSHASASSSSSSSSTSFFAALCRRGRHATTRTSAGGGGGGGMVTRAAAAVRIAIHGITNLHYNGALVDGSCTVSLLVEGKRRVKTQAVTGIAGCFVVEQECVVVVSDAYTALVRVHVVANGHDKAGMCVLALADLHRGAVQTRTHALVALPSRNGHDGGGKRHGRHRRGGGGTLSASVAGGGNDGSSSSSSRSTTTAATDAAVARRYMLVPSAAADGLAAGDVMTAPTTPLQYNYDTHTHHHHHHGCHPHYPGHHHLLHVVPPAGFITMSLSSRDFGSAAPPPSVNDEVQYVRLRRYYTYYLPRQLAMVDVHYSNLLNVGMYLQRLIHTHGPEPGEYKLLFTIVRCFSLRAGAYDADGVGTGGAASLATTADNGNDAMYGVSPTATATAMMQQQTQQQQQATTTAAGAALMSASAVFATGARVNPFCVVRCGMQEHRTAIVEGERVYEFHDTVTLTVGLPLRERVEVVVMNFFPSRSVEVGRSYVPLDSLRRGVPNALQLPIVAHTGTRDARVRGGVDVVLYTDDFGSDEAEWRQQQQQQQQQQQHSRQASFMVSTVGPMQTAATTMTTMTRATTTRAALQQEASVTAQGAVTIQPPPPLHEPPPSVVTPSRATGTAVADQPPREEEAGARAQQEQQAPHTSMTLPSATTTTAAATATAQSLYNNTTTTTTMAADAVPVNCVRVTLLGLEAVRVLSDGDVYVRVTQRSESSPSRSASRLLRTRPVPWSRLPHALHGVWFDLPARLRVLRDTVLTLKVAVSHMFTSTTVSYADFSLLLEHELLCLAGGGAGNSGNNNNSYSYNNYASDNSSNSSTHTSYARRLRLYDVTTHTFFAFCHLRVSVPHTLAVHPGSAKPLPQQPQPPLSSSSSSSSLTRPVLERILDDIFSVIARYSPRDLCRVHAIVAEADRVADGHRTLRLQYAPEAVATVYVAVHAVEFVDDGNSGNGQSTTAGDAPLPRHGATQALHDASSSTAAATAASNGGNVTATTSSLQQQQRQRTRNSHMEVTASIDGYVVEGKQLYSETGVLLSGMARESEVHPLVAPLLRVDVAVTGADAVLVLHVRERNHHHSNNNNNNNNERQQQQQQQQQQQHVRLPHSGEVAVSLRALLTPAVYAMSERVTLPLVHVRRRTRAVLSAHVGFITFSLIAPVHERYPASLHIAAHALTREYSRAYVRHYVARIFALLQRYDAHSLRDVHVHLYEGIVAQGRWRRGLPAYLRELVQRWGPEEAAAVAAVAAAPAPPASSGGGGVVAVADEKDEDEDDKKAVLRVPVVDASRRQQQQQQQAKERGDNNDNTSSTSSTSSSSSSSPSPQPPGALTFLVPASPYVDDEDKIIGKRMQCTNKPAAAAAVNGGGSDVLTSSLSHASTSTVPRRVLVIAQPGVLSDDDDDGDGSDDDAKHVGDDANTTPLTLTS